VTQMLTETASPKQVVDEIFRLFRERGDMMYGEDVTERMHGLQCGVLAEQAGCRPGLVAASLLHDLGHLLHDLGEDAAERGIDAAHEEVGDRWLRRWFPESVTEPARLHVDAKRYLCTIDAEYRAALSDASARSLELQGGQMSEDEVHDFESNPYFKDAITLRRFDDQGKDPDLAEVELERFRPVLEGVIARA